MTRTLLVGVAVLAAGAVGRGDDAAKAKAIVEKAVKAAGWEKDGPDVHLSWGMKGKFVAGGAAADFTGKWWFSGPDKVRFEVTVKFGDTDVLVTSVTNGGMSWESAMGEVREVTGEKLGYVKGQVHAYRVYSLTPLLADKGFSLKPVAGEKVDGAETDGVEVAMTGQPTITLYFDKKTGLPVKAAGTVKNEFDDWKDVKEEVYMSGWADGAGKRKVFAKLKIVRGGETMIEAEESDQRAHDKLDAKLFEELKK